MDNYFVSLDWRSIGTFFLLIVLLLMIFLFKRSTKDSEIVVRVGACLFILTFLFNTLGLVEISDYISILAFVIISFALLRLFWTDSKNQS